jgi:hypothetical protein
MARKPAITDDVIIDKIYLLRKQKIMLDRDLAELYNVTTGNLNKAVKRNMRRFPHDFMFQLTKEEYENLIIHFGVSGWGGPRKPPYAFTEQGVAMLSSVLNSDRAIKINIHIIRIFSRLRQMALTHKDVLLRLEQLERQVSKNNGEIQRIFSTMKQFISTPQLPRRKIGFKPDEDE